MNKIQLIEVESPIGIAMNPTLKSNDIKKVVNRQHNVSAFDRFATGFLIDNFIKPHHANARKNAVIIYDLIQKVAYQHGDSYPELKKFSEVAFFFFQDLLNQLLKEEQYLFPLIRQTEAGKGNTNNEGVLQTLRERIELQQIQYEKSFKYLKIFRQLTNNYRLEHNNCKSYKFLCKKMKEFEEDLNIYFHLENNILLNCMNLAEGLEVK